MSPARPARKVLSAHRVFRGLSEFRDRQAHKGHRARLDQPAPQVRQVTREFKARKVLPDQPDHKARQALRDLPVHKALLARQARKVMLAHRDP